LKRYFDEDVELHTIYRYMDKLHSTQQEQVQKISIEHTRRILGSKIGLVFYDVTTLYFETDYSDGLQERGFSKNGKHARPQVVLGLLYFTRRNFVRCSAVQKNENSRIKVCAGYDKKNH
jgi:transposase